MTEPVVPTQPTTFRRRPQLVDALTVTTDNLPAVAAWCAGQVVDGTVQFTGWDGTTLVAAPGDVLLLDPFGDFDVMTAGGFDVLFREV